MDLTSQSFNPSTLVENTRTILHLFLVHLVYNEVFWKGCLPGSKGNLCKVCLGGIGEAATKRCADNHNERYYGNMGALRFVEFFIYIIQSFPCILLWKKKKEIQVFDAIIFAGVWLEMSAVKAMAMWLSLSITAFRPTSSVRFSKECFERNTQTQQTCARCLILRFFNLGHQD